MKINNPLNKEFPFNVYSQSEYNYYVNRLDKMGYVRISFRNHTTKFPLRFTCINNNPNHLQYTIY